MGEDITRRINSDKELVKASKIIPGAAVAVPVGTTFVIIHKAKKNRIQNLGRTLSIISSGEELNLLHQRMLEKHPELPLELLTQEIQVMKSTFPVCDGTVARFDLDLRSKKRIMATPKDIERYLDTKLELMKSSTSDALPLNLM